MPIPYWCSGVERYAGIVDYPFWPFGWESAEMFWTCEATGGSGHRWELVYGGPAGRAEYAVRCEVCQVPRCGDSNDVDPCMRRRHHPLDGSPFVNGHLYLSHWSPDLTNVADVERWLNS